MIRLAADWDDIVGKVPAFRLSQLLGSSSSPTLSADEFVELLGAKQPQRAALLNEARDEHRKLTMAFADLNAVSTTFFSLSELSLDALEQQAFWQTLAMFAIYWEPWSSG